MPIRYTHRTVGGQDVPLTPREDELLTYLEGADEDTPYDTIDLERDVFGGVNRDRPGHLARVTVRRLRKKLEEKEVQAYRIRIRPGEGFWIDRTEE